MHRDELEEEVRYDLDATLLWNDDGQGYGRSAMYNVIVLAEQVMTPGDAAEVVSLHTGIEDQKHYHVLIPCDNAQVRVETALGSLGASDTWVSPVVDPEGFDTREVQAQLDSDAQTAVTASVAALQALGHQASGQFSSDDPLDTLDAVVAEQRADEVIVMTRPHVVQEFFHLDWTSKARRRLGVPVLHLVEHETLDAEAANGQGITGM
jgi:hypothetical protein